MTTKLPALQQWVDEVADRTQPDAIHWCTGTEDEYQDLIDLMVADGTMSGAQIWLVENFGRIFESTLLQELEWHSHTVLFAFVLGYGYIWNTHVRVDLVRESLSFRKKAWVELFGLTFFLIPFILIYLSR